MKMARGEVGGTSISNVILFREMKVKSKDRIAEDGTKSGRQLEGNEAKCWTKDMKRARIEVGGTSISNVTLLQEMKAKSKESIEGARTKTGKAAEGKLEGEGRKTKERGEKEGKTWC